jgi:thioredoxin 1
MPTVQVTDATFEARVLASDKPVLVDFWAAWCAPCKQVAPILEELSNSYADALTIAKLDVDANPGVSRALRIQSIPTMVLFVGGRPVKSLQGAVPKATLVEFLEKHLPSLRKPTVTPDELAALIERGAPVMIVDIRDPRDFSRAHLLRSKCMDAEALAREIGSVHPRSLVVLVCRSGERSLELAQSLGESGPQVVALEKGILAWQGSQRPTYSDKEEAALGVRER